MSHLYFTLTLYCSLHIQDNVWTLDCGRNMSERRAIHHQRWPGCEIQPGPYQQWLLSCMLDLMLVYLSPKQLHNVWFIEESGWYYMLTTSLGSWLASLSMIMLHTVSTVPSQKAVNCLFVFTNAVIPMKVLLFWWYFQGVLIKMAWCLCWHEQEKSLRCHYSKRCP